MPCLWVIIHYSSINSSIFMSRFTIITKDIYVTFIIVYYQYIRTYDTSVSVRVEFNLYLRIIRTISNLTVTIGQILLRSVTFPTDRVW